MRISLVSEHASPLALVGGVDAGGQNVHVAELAQSLARHGAEVVVHTRRDDPVLARRVQFAPGVVVDHVDAGPPEPLPKDELLSWMGAFASDLVEQWRTETPAVVHAHFWMSGIASVLAGEHLGVPVALTYHALGIEKRRHQGARDTSPTERVALEQWLARTVDHVISTAGQERRALLAMGARTADVTVVPCGVDPGRFRPEGPVHPPRTAARLRIGCLSRLVPRKGIADVIRSLVLLPDAELIVAGGPPESMLHDDPEAAALLHIATESGVDHRVRFVGAVGRHEAPALLRSCDVVCCSPWYEPFGLVAVEAMACGVPVVASRVGGLAETVVDGRTGFLVPARSPEAIATAIAELADDDARRRGMGRAARERAADYGWDRIGARTLEVLRRLAESGRARRTIPPQASWRDAPLATAANFERTVTS